MFSVTNPRNPKTKPVKLTGVRKKLLTVKEMREAVKRGKEDKAALMKKWGCILGKPGLRYRNA